MSFARVNAHGLAILTVAAFLSACGGGDGSSGSANGTSTSSTSAFVTWSGSANGTVVKDYSNNNFMVRSADGVVVDSTDTALSGLTVSGTTLNANGVSIGHVASVASTSAASIAAFQCSDNSGLIISINATSQTYTRSCLSSSATAKGGTTAASGGGGGKTVASPATTSYVTFTGSGNGNVVLDGKNQQFKVRSADGLIVQATNNIGLSGASVVNNTVVINGSNIGSVSLVNTTGGASVAEFLCASGTPLNFTLTTTSFSYACTPITSLSSSTTSSTSGSSGTSGASGTSGTSTTSTNSISTPTDYSATYCVPPVFNDDGTISFTNVCGFAVTLFTSEDQLGDPLVTLYPGQTTPIPLDNGPFTENACETPSIPVTSSAGCTSP